VLSYDSDLLPPRPVAIFTRAPNDPFSSPLLRYRLPLVSRDTRSGLPSPVMSPVPTTVLYEPPHAVNSFARALNVHNSRMS